MSLNYTASFGPVMVDANNGEVTYRSEVIGHLVGHSLGECEKAKLTNGCEILLTRTIEELQFRPPSIAAGRGMEIQAVCGVIGSP